MDIDHNFAEIFFRDEPHSRKTHDNTPIETKSHNLLSINMIKFILIFIHVGDIDIAIYRSILQFYIY